jgi:hypothetical protein
MAITTVHADLLSTLFHVVAKVFDLALSEIEKKSPSSNRGQEEKGGCVIM